MSEHPEALERLRSTNPVPAAETIDPDEIAAVAALCEERRLTPEGTANPGRLQAPRPRVLGPALAFSAAFVTIIVAAGLFALFGRSGSPVADEPEPTIPTTSIVASTTTTLPPEATEAVAFEAYNEPPDANGIAIGPDGSIWVATSWAGVARWLPGADEPVFSSVHDGLRSDAVDQIAIAVDGTAWAGGRGWIARLGEDGVWNPITVPDPIEALAVGPDGTAWLSREPNRLLTSTGADYETITLSELPVVGSDGVEPWSLSLAIAPDGTVWAGTINGTGVVSWDGTTTSIYGPADGLPAADFTSVAVAPDGRVWTGFANGLDEPEPTAGVATFDGVQWTVYSTDDGLLTNNAEVAVGSDGTAWAIHYAADGGTPGVSRFDGEGWTAFSGIEGRGMGAAVDADGTLWMIDPDGAVVEFDGTSASVRELPLFETLRGTEVPPIGSWDPILAETLAKEPPAAAACPAGADPDVPGPISQDRPWAEWYSDQPADFDRVWGRILLVDANKETWTFDVCTNTWQAMGAEGILPPGGSLVYDVDSDRSVLFGDRAVWVYDRDTNGWDLRIAPLSSTIGWGGPAAFYDPQSGLIINAKRAGSEYGDGWELNAYDVDADVWTTLGTTDRTRGQIVGYVHAADRLVALDAISEFGMTLIDPRTGYVEEVDQDHPEIVGGFGSVTPVNGADTVYGRSFGGGDGVCRIRPQGLGWECVPRRPDRSGAGHNGYSPFRAGVYDWINERLVMFGGGYGGWNDEPMTYFGDVWSLDPETGEWLQLLAPTP